MKNSASYKIDIFPEMASRWTITSGLAVIVFICFVFYKTVGNNWLFPHLLSIDDSSINSTIQTTTMSPMNLPPERESLYEERRRNVIQGCKKVNRTIEKLSNLNTNSLKFERKHFIYYCPIAKVGSTFWKRVLTVIDSQGRLKSPFEISLGRVRLSKWDALSQHERIVFKDRGTSFLFVRDPYARLFSGYENKIYHSNLLFWKSIGRKVVNRVRKNNETLYQKYGFDVTFPEFVKYILFSYDSGRKINGHFSPMINHCDPCATHFQYIGKLETIKDDAIYLISKWRNEFKDFNLHFDDFEKETVMDTATGHVRFLFKTKKILKEIKFPFIKLMLRTWRDLQIRGYLSKSITFPFNETDADKITREDFVEAIRKALNIPVNQTEVKQQRDEALIQSYRQVPIEDLERLRKYLLKDCLLFGYDDRPQKLFDRSQPVNDDFLYLDGLKGD